MIVLPQTGAPTQDAKEQDWQSKARAAISASQPAPAPRVTWSGIHPAGLY